MTLKAAELAKDRRKSLLLAKPATRTPRSTCLTPLPVEWLMLRVIGKPCVPGSFPFNVDSVRRWRHGTLWWHGLGNRVEKI
jgi:hypothetical protein